MLAYYFLMWFSDVCKRRNILACRWTFIGHSYQPGGPDPGIFQKSRTVIIDILWIRWLILDWCHENLGQKNWKNFL